jgi:sec-independent protein translocase protein TatA
MPFGIGVQELLIVLVLALIILGPKRLPEVGRSIGSGMREFRDSISGPKRDDDEDYDLDATHHRVEPTSSPK